LPFPLKSIGICAKAEILSFREYIEIKKPQVPGNNEGFQLIAVGVPHKGQQLLYPTVTHCPESSLSINL